MISKYKYKFYTSPQIHHCSCQFFVIFILVTIDGSNFKGFFIQARAVHEPEPHQLGTFTPLGSTSQTRDCTYSRDSATHTSADVKSQIVLRWTPPTDNHGDIRFL